MARLKDLNMKMFSDCRGPCEKCLIHYNYMTCLAGHGDDDFEDITKKDFDEIIESKDVSDSLKKQLRDNFPEFCKKD